MLDHNYVRSSFKVVLCVLLLSATLLLSANRSEAIYLHNFACNNCHVAGVSLYASGNSNLCVQCHRSGGGITTDDGRTGPASEFSENDLSNAMGTHNDITPTAQTSHTWAAMQDTNTAAGATRATTALYYSRYGVSNGKVTCGKCHNPHATFTGTPGVNAPLGTHQSLRIDNSSDQICKNCHTAWDNNPALALGTHPINIPLSGASVSGSISDANVQLVGGNVSCSTCHGVHWVDSKGSTTDGPAGSALTGDGKLLVTDGRSENPNTLCQACHTYEHHGSGMVGCLDCHAGHSASGNYFVLRDEITQVQSKKTGGLVDLSGINYTQVNTLWKNGGAGYCENCHTLPAGDHNGFTTGGKAECSGCHDHTTSGGAFGGACNSCHGYAPSVNTAGGPNGYASDTTNYQSNGVNPKDEGTTPHINHSDPLTDSSPNHNLSCQECHANFSTTHQNDVYEDVVFNAIAQTGTASPSYNGSGSGSCASVYCHSNGNDGNFQSVNWAGGRNTINDCASCHGNTAAAMTTAGNTASHTKHLNKYSNDCSICHVDTASDNATLVRVGTSSQINANHVSGAADVVFDTSFALGAGTLGSTNDYSITSNCSAVYCHSNGKGNYITADWGTATGGTCGDCHQVNASGDSGTALSGSHNKHLFDTNGPQLSCSDCHGTGAEGTAADSGTHNGHVNGDYLDAASLKSGVCDTCHGIDGAEVSPTWGLPATVNCETCHSGASLSVIGGNTAPDKSTALASGHNKPNGSYGSGNPAANQSCDSCHDAASAGHFDGVSGDDQRLPGGFDCNSCHATIVTHQAKTCATCHDPHGDSNLYMVRSSSGDYNGTVVFTATSGADSYDEADSGAGANDDDICATCHTDVNQTNPHNNKEVNGLHLAGSKQGQDCMTCHNDHTDAGGAFGVGAGSSCDGCHGFPPTTAAHTLHAPDGYQLDLAGDVLDTEDRSACAHCHTGADLYTYDPSADSSSGTPGRQNHAAGEATQDGTLLASVGYDAANLNCTSACHNSTVADGAWNDTALDCDACHDGKKTDTATIASGSHSPHLAVAANDCDTCHGSIPADTTHITDKTGADEITKVTGMAQALPDEANVTVTTFNDGTNNCSNAACHDPSGTGYSATWGTPNAVACAFCHSETDPATNEHTQHLGSNIAMDCTTCHVNNGADTAHLDGTVDVTSAAISSYTSPNCTNACHSLNGVDNTASTGDDASWTAAVSLGCADCHDNTKTGITSNLEPTSGLHAATTALTHDETLLGGNCVNCHDSANPSAAHIGGGAKQNSTQTTFTFAAGVTYDNTNYASSDTSCMTACHSDGGDWNRRWVGVTDAIPLNTNNPSDAVCQNCHGDFSAWRGINVSHTDPYAGNTGDKMDQHAACQTCHGWGNANYDETWGAPSANNGHGDGNITMNGPSPTTGAQYDDATGGCTAACHSSAFVMDTNSGWTANYIDGGSGACDVCHTSNSVTHANASENSALHDAHNASLYVDIEPNWNAGDIATWDNCDTCHPHNGEFIASHDNGTVNFANNIANTYDYAKGASFGGSCGATNGCHDSDSGEWAAGNLANAADNACEDCHGSSATFFTTLNPAWPISSNEHTGHINNNSGVPNDCNDCHGAGATSGTQAGHKDTTVDLAGQITDLTLPADGTCTNTCHWVVNGRDWTSGTTLNCTDCHTSGKSLDGGGEADLSTSVPPNSNKHDQHVGNGYIGDCASCHTHDGALAASSNGHVNGLVTTGSKITGGGANCTNTCHSLKGLDNIALNADDAAWAAADTDKPGCADCHDNAKTGLAASLEPSSGLHAATTAMQHGIDFNGGDTCISCHQITPTTSHVDTTGPEAETATTYNFNAGNIGSYSNANGCASSCHLDGGKWSRAWVGVADAKPDGAAPGDAVCDNCHGDGLSNATTADSTWRTGVVPVHETDWDGDTTANEVLQPVSNHGTCQSCHGWNNGNYNAAYNGAVSAVYVGHGDGNITMNGPDPTTGAKYNETDFGCAAACHQGSYAPLSGDANEDHVMADSAWPVNFGDFGSGDCNTCHAGLGADHSSTNENTLTHDAHTGSNYVGGCADCHTHDGLSVPPGTGDHNNGTVNFNGTTLTATDYSRDAGNFNDSCTNNCHDVDTTEWSVNSLGGDSCVDCHAATGKLLDQGAYPPTSGAHTEHVTNADADYVDDCNSCHGPNANTGAHSGHKDNAANITIGAALTTYDTGNNNCTNTCHTAGDVNEWTAGSLACTDCHNSGLSLDGGGDASFSASVAPPTGKHDKHMLNGTYVADCATCHGHNGPLGVVDTHVDGPNLTTIDTAGSISSYASQSCTNSCHTVTSAADDGWVNDARTLECNDCHSSTLTLDGGGEADLGTTVGPNAGRHDVHMANGNYVSNGCIDCHGHEGALGSPGVTGHLNGGAITVASQTTSYDTATTQTCTNSCHDVVDGRDWTAGVASNGSALACADCHAATGKSLDQGAWPPVSNAHAEHSASNALPNATQSDCYACHGTTVDNSGDLTGNTTHLNLTVGDVSFNTAFDYEAGSAGVAAGSGASTTCSAVACHNGATTPTWGAGTIACGACHGSGSDPLPTGSIGNGHSLHANNDADYTDCRNCHSSALSYTAVGGNVLHQNLTVDLTFDASIDPTADNSYTDGDGAAGMNYAGDFTDDGTCSNVECHSNTVTPAWNATASAYPNRCVVCHNDGTAGTNLENAVPTATSGIHSRHVVDAATTYVDDCNACHGANASTGAHTGHSNLATTYGNSLAGYAAGSCTTNTCHDDAAGNLWTNGATLACSDCHSSLKTLDGGGEADLSTSIGPNAGEHDAHMGNAAILTGGCADCHGHSGDFASAGHADAAANITVATDVSVYTPADGTCTNTCHSVADGRDWTSGTTLDCTDCHSSTLSLDGGGENDLSASVGPNAGEHDAHTAANANYMGAASCTTCHGHSGALAGASNGHVDTNKDVDGTNITTYTAADGTCANACHNVVDGRDWTSATTLNCTDCHTTALLLGAGGDATMSGTVAPVSGKHTVHMNNTNYAGDCTDCHSHNGTLGTAGHVNGPTNSDIEVANSITVSPIPADDTCTNSCHDVADGRDWTVGTLVCADCHAATGKSLDQGAWPPVSNAHAEHSASNALPNATQSDCYACHGTTVDNSGDLTGNTTHLNLTVGDVSFNTAFDYEAGSAGVAAGSGASTTCSAVACHNGATTPTWGAGTIACGACHGSGSDPLPTGSIGNGHSLHANNDADYTDCRNCHSSALSYTAVGGNVLHQNLTVDLTFDASIDPTADNSYTDGDGAAGMNYAGDFTDDGTCSNVECHSNTVTPAWNATASAYPNRCVVCHNDGTAGTNLENAVPTATSGIHSRHVVDAATTYVDDCNACHGANASTGAHTGHSNLATTYGNSLAGYAAGSCTTNTCHDDAAGNLWTNGATLACNDCHSSLKTLDGGGEADLSTTIGPNAGQHDVHMLQDGAQGNYVPNGCTDCHGHSGDFVSAGHADAAANITVATEVSVYTPVDGTCTNSCHSVVDGRDWTSATALSCADCHDAATKTLFRDRTSGSHAAHVDTASAPTSGDYGNLTNATTTTTYDFGCGECHPAVEASSHLQGGAVEVAAGVGYNVSNQCTTADCHSNGQAAPVYATTPAWGNTFAGDKCASCHLNSPNTGAHSAHNVGIHYDSLYSGTTGLMAAGSTNTSAHGNAGTATTINCNVCHSNTVTSSANDQNTVCASCHDGGTAALQGDAAIADKTFHVNGTRNVAFAAGSVASKAQLRDNIADAAEVGATWTRNVGYKSAGAFDGSISATPASFAAGSCSAIVCHNGGTATWTAPVGDCTACHTTLPQ